MSKIVDKLFDHTVPGLEKLLDLSWRRGQALTSNVANAETPMYRAVDLNFASELDRAFERQPSAEIKQTNSKHMDLQSQSSAHLVADYSGATKADGNNVDIDIQMGKLRENSGKYSMASNLIRKKLQIMRMVIQQSQQ